MYVIVWFFLFFKQKTAYEMRISDCSSDVCSSDLPDIAILIPQDGADLTAPEIDYCTRHGASSPQLHSSPASPSEDLRTLCRALPVSDRGSSGLSLASGMTSRRRSSISSARIILARLSIVPPFPASRRASVEREIDRQSVVEG